MYTKKYNLYLTSAVFLAQVLVRPGPSKQLKQIIQIEHSIVKNPNWPVPCEQLVSPTPNERETTASNRLLFHRACASSARTPHVMHLMSISFVNTVKTGQAFLSRVN